MHAIVLAGGQGERLRPFTEDRPKAMVEIAGTPILSYQLQWLRAQGITNLIIASGYRHEVIERHFGTGESLGVRIVYSVEHEPLGRGGALRAALACVPANEDVVIATNGDVITDFQLEPLLAAHRAVAQTLATVVLTPFVSPFGIVEVDERDRVTRFREKPELPYWINAGVYALSPAIRELLPERGDHETTTFPHLAETGRLGAFRSHAYWRGVDTMKDVNEVAAALRGRALTFSREA